MNSINKMKYSIVLELSSENYKFNSTIVQSYLYYRM